MVYLAASIISSSTIYVIFRIAKNYNCNLTSLIMLNYLAATVLGFLLFEPFNDNVWHNSFNWLPFAIIIGVLYIAMFYLIGNSSQKAGITVTTLANKLSLVFPVLFSLIYFNEQITIVKYIGLSSAFVAILLTLFKKDIRKTNLIFILLPVTIFFGSGIIDSIVKYVQALKIESSQTPLFSSFVFLVALVLGIIVTLINRSYNKIRHTPTLILGILLGLVNFGSLYFILNALNRSNLESSLVFAINNMSIVALSAILGMLFFKEKLSFLNFAGLVLAMVSLYFLV